MDGNLVVICHCSQCVAFCNSKSAQEVELSHAFREINDALLCHKVYQHFGGNDSGLTEVNKDKLLRK